MKVPSKDDADGKGTASAATDEVTAEIFAAAVPAVLPDKSRKRPTRADYFRQ